MKIGKVLIKLKSKPQKYTDMLNDSAGERYFNSRLSH